MPQAPADLRREKARWLGREGVGVSWEAPKDRTFISYYELARDGEPLTKVATGTYYFDTDREADHARYAVRSVDFDGRASDWTEEA